MKKLVIAIALCAALAACKKEDAAPAADVAAPAADTAAPADDAMAPAGDAMADAAAPAASDLPQECEDYLARTQACFAQSSGNAAAAAFQQGVDQTRAASDAVADKSTLAAGCKMANDQFAQTAAMLKCE